MCRPDGESQHAHGRATSARDSIEVSRIPNVTKEEDWWSAVEASGPASLLLIIQDRLGGLAREIEPEDVLQESLIRGWRFRASLEWRGQRAFRAWLLTVIDNTISDLRSERLAAKRSPRAGQVVPLGDGHEPWAATTPSKVAAYREQAALVQRAIELLPEDVREIVSLRIIHQRPMADIATSLGLSLATVQHRLRRGAMMYRDRLRAQLLPSSSPATSVPDGKNAARPQGHETPLQCEGG